VSRRLFVLLSLSALATGCLRDRDRPSPVEPEAQASLSVQLLEPRPGVTLIAGREIMVRVSARDLSGEHLTGVGFVARRFGFANPTVDSVAFHFQATTDTIREFAFAVPASLPTSTQLDIFGIAYGPGTQARLSTPNSVIVAQCTVGQAGC
jgi:hypothetical protein